MRVESFDLLLMIVAPLILAVILSTWSILSSPTMDPSGTSLTMDSMSKAVLARLLFRFLREEAPSGLSLATVGSSSYILGERTNPHYQMYTHFDGCVSFHFSYQYQCFISSFSLQKGAKSVILISLVSKSMTNHFPYAAGSDVGG